MGNAMFDYIKNCIVTPNKTKRLLDHSFRQAPPACIVNDEGQIIFANQALANLLNATEEQLSRLEVKDVIKIDEDCSSRELVNQLCKKEIPSATFEKNIITTTGKILTCIVTSTWVENDNYMIIHITDISERKQNEQLIYNYAYYDNLTQIPNRQYFTEYVTRRLEPISNTKQAALLIFDLDGFKYYNDTHGHQFGDELLVHVAETIHLFTQYIRKYILDVDIFCARLGGDEFVIFIDSMASKTTIATIAQQLLQFFKAPFKVQGQRVLLNLSIGVSFFPSDGENLSMLLRAADLALHDAKYNNKGHYIFYNERLHTTFQQYSENEKATRYYSRTKNFEIKFQPIVDIHSEQIVTAESLFRANDKKLPIQNIQNFIITAERNGTIHAIGNEILRRVCQTIFEIQENIDDHFSLSINVSTTQLNDQRFSEKVLEIISEYGIRPTSLCLEMTETSIMHNYELSISHIRCLRNAGVKIAIDDFGDGYSSLSYIQHLPASTIKIDKKFIDDVVTDNKTREVVTILQRIADTFSMYTCAEGVENGEQVQLLKQLGIDFIQGYYYYKPMTKEQLMQALEEQNE